MSMEFPGMKAARKNDSGKPSQLDEMKRLKGIYSRVFDSDDGKELLKDLEDRNFLDRTTFDSDPYITAFHEGQRAVLVYIKNVISLDIAKEEENYNARESDNESPGS